MDEAMRIAERTRNKKAEDILLLDIHQLGTIADYLILTSANSKPHMRAIAEDVRLYVKRKHKQHVVLEGTYESQWVILDMGAVIVHVMEKEVRDYYRLEELWSRGETAAYYL